MNEKELVEIMKKSNNRTSLVWRSIRDNDEDRNGFLGSDELESCFREHFPHELEGKSLIHYFRKYSTDHDKNLVNYTKIKQSIVNRMSGIDTEEIVATSLTKSNTVEKLMPMR